ncbi:hypothetical protein M7784_12880 [Desulfovibrio aminophilus]|nr:hypothetical protein [Desulfovibrio aminophilus]MCM0756130.1 hypothetical protein [Desulfovibrio aminophilus]
MKSEEDRLYRFQKACDCIQSHPRNKNFVSLIEPNRDIFREFRLIYSTDDDEYRLGNIKLSEIYTKCSSLIKFYYGNGLLFFSDQIYDSIINNKNAEICIDYSFIFDSNVAIQLKNFMFGNIPSPINRFFELINYIKLHKINCDIIFFILEYMQYAMNPKKPLIYDTIFAFKQFDQLKCTEITSDFKQLLIRIDKNIAAQNANLALNIFNRDHNIQLLLHYHSISYMLLLKTIIIQKNSPANHINKLSELINYCITKTGRFLKTEMYFAWKIFKFWKKHKYLQQIVNINSDQKATNRIKMIRRTSWDLFSIRFQEIYSTTNGIGHFFIPFFVSFENKLINFSKKCPVKCLIVDDKTGMANTIFEDDNEFNDDITKIDKNILQQLTNKKNIRARLKNNCHNNDIENNIMTLESEFNKLF